MRDRLIHSYFGVDYEIVWDVVSNKVPALGQNDSGSSASALQSRALRGKCSMIAGCEGVPGNLSGVSAGQCPEF